MALRLPDKWLWDFWLAQDGLDYHVFYLQASRALQDEKLRHWNVSIGHAVSQDLRRWEILPDALRPSRSESGAWDDYTTWTGSIIRHEGTWFLFYTGGSLAEKGRVQRIGLATSDDLIHWDRHPANPIIVADPRWYESLDPDLWHEQAWRDPWVFRHPEAGDFHAFITARANHGPPDGRGVIGHARSDDLVHWDVLPPLIDPGDFGHMEVPQLVEIDGGYYLLFCAVADVHSSHRRQRIGIEPESGTHYLVADDPLGPFRFATEEFLVGDEIGSLYAGKLVRGPDGDWCFLASHMFAADGTFVGQLSDPLPVKVASNGNLSVDWRRESVKARHRTFLASRKRHILMITNHGVHQWRVIPGLPDTGGQNAFVNQFTAALAELGFKVTIVNRGGYPHPVTGELRGGVHYRGGHQRILYLEDGLPDFVRKEDMDERMPHLVESLKRSMDVDVDLIISHYWDGAKLGALYNRALPQRARHVWIPHSLGAIKKRNVSPQQWPGLRIDERIAIESSLMTGGELDGIVATSSKIGQSLEEDYRFAGMISFLPPCVDPERFHPREVSDEDDVWRFLSQRSGLSPEEVRRCRIVTEISRTDATKRKDVLIRAFDLVRRRIPNSLLVVSIDENAGDLARDLAQLIRSLGLQRRVAVVGSIWSLLPTVYAVTDVYCTPSVMEGFGMSAQEAAATAVPVVGSHLIPFVSEYLLGDEVEVLDEAGRPGLAGEHHPIRWGQGAVAVQADDVDGFATAIELLLADDDLRREMGTNAYHITIPYFTWPHRVAAFLNQIGVSPEGGDEETYEPAD